MEIVGTLDVLNENGRVRPLCHVTVRLFYNESGYDIHFIRMVLVMLL